jgi:hypothetical protein
MCLVWFDLSYDGSAFRWTREKGREFEKKGLENLNGSLVGIFGAETIF